MQRLAGLSAAQQALQTRTTSFGGCRRATRLELVSHRPLCNCYYYYYYYCTRSTAFFPGQLLLLSLWHTNSHTRLTALFSGTPNWAGTRKVKPLWILLKQETVSGSGISWDICKSAPHSRQSHQHPTTQFFTGRMLFLLPNQRHQSTEGKNSVIATHTHTPV